jgi:IPT/TIG domain
MLSQTGPGRAARVGSAVIALSLLAACGSNPSGPSGTGNAPTLNGITPATGPASGGTSVNIAGANFTAGATMTIGGVAATDVSVVSGGSITGKTGPHAAGAADVVVTQAGQSARLVNAFTYVAGAPPVIQSIVAQGTRHSEPAQFADLNEQINVTALVTDADTSAAALQYTWSTDLGTIAGTGSKVTWTAPASAATPAKVTITLSVSDGGTAVTGTSAVTLHNSTKEIGDIATLFLVNFSKTEVPVDTVMQDFTPECPGTAAERQDVINNRNGFVITSWNVQSPQVTIDFGAGCDTVHGLREGDGCSYSQVRWDSNKVGGGTDSVEGVDQIGAVFLSDRWWLCSSDFDGHHLNGTRFLGWGREK